MGGEVAAAVPVPMPVAPSLAWVAELPRAHRLLAGGAAACPPGRAAQRGAALHASAGLGTSSAGPSSAGVAAAVGAGVSAAVGAVLGQRRQAKQGRVRKDGRAMAAVVALDSETQVLEAPTIAEALAVEAPAPATEDAMVSFWDVLQHNGALAAPVSFDGIRHQEETAQDRVFHWLRRAPKPGSECFKSLQKYFPGALPGSAVHLRTKYVLEQDFGCSTANTLLGTSFCPDEINNQAADVATLMRKHWGKVFPMGGIGGVPYVGETGFKAFSSHVADDGNIIVIFGPHVGISEAGEVGQYLREGQKGSSTACGAVIGALNACMSSAEGSPIVDDGRHDMQMNEIKQEFALHAERISKSESPMASAAYQAYEMVKSRMQKIVNTKFGSGKLVLIGGIQINLPHPELEDHFLPMMFEVRQQGQTTKDLMHHLLGTSQQDLKRSPWVAATAQREVFSWLSWSPPPISPVYLTMQKYFPGALPGQAVHERMLRVLEKFGFTKENTILGTSVCPDEINNESTDLAVLMQDHWGEVFPMGGISGAPFAGKTGFKAFSSHVAEEGNIIVVFGPHVAISAFGEVGTCLRHGQREESTACGAVVGAYKACLSGDTGSQASGAYDPQMDWIKQQIAPHVDGIQRSLNPMASLAHRSYAMVRDEIYDVVNNDFGSGYLCLIGGIQINMPAPMEDHFMPCSFEVRRAGEPAVDLLRDMKEFS